MAFFFWFFFLIQNLFTEPHPQLFHTPRNMILGQTPCSWQHFTRLLFHSEPSTTLCQCRSHKSALPQCQERGARALGSAVAAVSTPAISAISPDFQEKVGRQTGVGMLCKSGPGHAWCYFLKLQPWNTQPLEVLLPASLAFWHWRSQGDKGSDVADIGHQHHLAPVLIHTRLKTIKLLWSQKKEKKKWYVIWISCCLLVIKFVTILTDLGTMEGIRKKRQREGKYNKSLSGPFSFWFCYQRK